MTRPRTQDARPDFEALCRQHQVSPELADCTADLDKLLRRILAEYEHRLTGLSPDALAEGAGESEQAEVRKLRSLFMFAARAVALEERAKAEEQLRQEVDRNALLVRVIGVLAHKINNPLTSLLGRAQMLLLGRETDPKTRKAAEVIEESAQRVAELVRELALVVRSGDETQMLQVLEKRTEPASKDDVTR